MNVLVVLVQTIMFSGKFGNSYWTRIVFPLFLAILLALCLDIFLQVRKPGRAYSAGGYGFPNPNLDLKFPQFFKEITNGNIPDVIFVGNSMANHDLYPESFSAGFAETGGFSPRCFNLGSSGMNRHKLKELLSIIRNFAGNVPVIWGCYFVDFRDLDFKSEQVPLSANDWLRFRMGKWNLRGWLTEHSRLIRVFSLLRLRLEFPAGWKRHRTFSSFRQNNGYFLRNLKPKEKVTDRFIDKKTRAFRNMEFPRDLTPRLAETLQHEKQAHLFVAILPVHKGLIAIMKGQGLNPALETRRLLEAFRQLGYPAVGPPEQMAFIDSYWKDFNHMNHPGAKQYSYWLGRQLGARYQSGELKPFAAGMR